MKNIVRNMLLLSALVSIGARAESKTYDLSRPVEELTIAHINFKLVHSADMGNKMRIVADEAAMKCLNVSIRSENIHIKCKRGAKKKMANESIIIYLNIPSSFEDIRVTGATGVVEGDIVIKDNDDFDVELKGGANVTFKGKISAPEVDVNIRGGSIVKFAVIDARLDGFVDKDNKLMYQRVTGEVKLRGKGQHGPVDSKWW